MSIKHVLTGAHLADYEDGLTIVLGSKSRVLESHCGVGDTAMMADEHEYENV